VGTVYEKCGVSANEKWKFKVMQQHPYSSGLSPEIETGRLRDEGKEQRSEVGDQSVRTPSERSEQSPKE
jgi:hypothetical protein